MGWKFKPGEIKPEFVPDASFAGKLFKAQMDELRLEDEFWHHIDTILGLDPITQEIYQDVTYDYYDRSFELKDVEVGFNLIEDHCDKFVALGFDHCWLNYTDGSQKHYYFKKKA